MTTQELIDNLRAYDVVVRDTSTTLAVRIAADKMATANEKAIRAAADKGDLVAQVFLVARYPEKMKDPGYHYSGYIDADGFTIGPSPAAKAGDAMAQAFLRLGTSLQETLDQLKAAHVAECDERCHSCTACYQRTGDTRCDKNCPHTMLEDFDE